MLRLALPEIYGRVTYVGRLSELNRLVESGAVEIPQHVEDYDKSLQN